MILAGCASVAPQDSVCGALRSVQLDSEGYFPRKVLLSRLQLRDSEVRPIFMAPDTAYAPLGNGLELQLSWRDASSTRQPPAVLVGDPATFPYQWPGQVSSAVVFDQRRNRVVCRIDALATDDVADRRSAENLIEQTNRPNRVSVTDSESQPRVPHQRTNGTVSSGSDQSEAR